MGFHKKIRILFLIILAVLVISGLTVLVSSQDLKQNVYSNSLPGKCSLKSMWQLGQFSTPVLGDLRDCPLKGYSSCLVQLLRSICSSEASHVNKLEDATLWQAIEGESSTVRTHQLLLQNVFQHLKFSTVLFVFLYASILTQVARQFRKAAGSNSISDIEKYGILNFKSLLSNFNFSSVSNPDKEMFTDDNLQLKSGRKYAWMFAPVKKIVPFGEYIIFSVLERVASYRQLLSSTSRLTNNSYFVSLAEAGFKYSGVGSAVECQACRSLVDIRNFSSPAVEAKYHKEGCSFVNDQEASNSGHHDNHLVEASNNVHHDNYQVEVSNNVCHDNQDMDTYSVAEVEIIKRQEQTQHNEHWPGNDNSKTSVGTQHKTPENDHSQSIQSQNEVSSPEEPLSDNSNHHEVTGAHQVTSEQEPPNQAAALNQEQISETIFSKQQQTVSVTNPEEIGACAAPDGSSPDHSTARDVSNFNALLFDTDEFSPEHCDVPIMDTCQKNPGHFANIPMGQLQLDHIPSKLRNADVFRLIQLVGKMIVRIEVRTTSQFRPNCSEYRKTRRFGTGMAITHTSSESDASSNAEISSKWNSLRKYLQRGRSKGYIYVQTIRHLVYDNHEAQQTLVEFFYDSPNRRGSVIAKGVSVEHSQILGNFRSILKCKINDLSMLEFVKNTEDEIAALSRGFPQNIKEELMKRVFVISHPHGGEKIMTYGEHVMVKYALKIGTKNEQPRPELVKINNHTQVSQNSNEFRKVLLYTADTCPGSSGAAVISFKKKKHNNTEDIVLDLWMHGGVCKNGLNASVMRELTADDIANHGHTEIFRPSVQENQEAEAESAANQIVSCPVFVVFSPPTHPAYAVYRKRLESYPNPFNHVHTAIDLADGGFYYAGYDDCVRCFHCGLGLKSWKSGDSIYEEHIRNRPDCQFLQMKLKASGISQFNLQSVNQRRISQTSFHQPETLLRSESENCQQLPDLAQHLGTQSSQRDPVAETQLMKQITSVPNYPQEIVVAVVHGSTIQNNALSSDTKSMKVQVLEREQQYLKQMLTCKVCLRNPVKDLFLPCGELVACLECSKLLTHCPSCNKKILATVTTFFS